jgi:hypothetical protein
MRLLRISLSLCLLATAAVALAQDDMWSNGPMSSNGPTWDESCLAGGNCASGDSCMVSDVCEPPCCYYSSGWFAGVGGSYNSVKVDSTVSGVGTSQIYSGSTLVAIGTAGGPAAPFADTETTFAPLVQLGYVQNVEGSDWLWGTKLSYKYLGLTLSDDGFDAPQTGVYEVLSPPSTSTLTGNAYTDSAQTLVDHELALIPFLGRSFDRGRFYFGGGPVVFDTESRLYGLSSYADINGVHTNIGGAPLNLASSNWMWGGAGQMGMMYYFNPSCFLDVSYDFMVTGEYTQNWPQEVTTSSNGLTYDTSINYKEVLRLWAQSVNVTFNMRF